jgi:hypothetical protein
MKCLIPLVLICVGSFAAHAQTYTAIKAGGGFSTLHLKVNDNAQARMGWYAGFSANFSVQDQLFVRTELLYSVRGYKYPATFISTKANIGHGYLSLPLLAGYKPIKKLSLMAGPEIGYLLFAKAKTDTDNSNILNSTNRRFSVDANMGTAYELTPELAIEAHFLVGLTSLYRTLYTDDNGVVTGPSSDGLNRTVQFGIIYKMSGN